MSKDTVAGCPECDRIERARGVLVRGAFAVHGKPEAGPVPGWLVVAPRRHVEQLDDLTPGESGELGPLLRDVSAAVRQAAGGEKVYLAAFSELLPHLHFHVAARPAEWPAAERGAALLLSARQVEAAQAARVTQAALALLARGASSNRDRARRSVGRSHKALLLSALVCPGAGQLANGERAKGLAMIAAALLGTGFLAWRLATTILGDLPSGLAMADPDAWAAAVAGAQAHSSGPLAAGTLLMSLLWLYSAWDAHQGSRS